MADMLTVCSIKQPVMVTDRIIAVGFNPRELESNRLGKA